MKNKKWFIGAGVILIIGILIFAIWLNSGMDYNEKGATGNTNGNLYNGGLFCEYNGQVYFANPDDKNSLYKMNMEGTEFEKLNDDTVSYINVCNDYIYYKRFNDFDNENSLFSRLLYGIIRMSTNGSGEETLHSGKIDSMTLCGNYLYYRYYDDETLFSLRKVKIDGEEDELINDEDYQPIAVYNGEIYFTNVSGNSNLMALNTDNNKIRTVEKGNFYMPDLYGDNLYYIDLDNNRALTRMNLNTKVKTVLSKDKVINYNLSGKYNVIYYQAENSVSDHKLCKMATDGSGLTTVALGDYGNISITKKYTYFFHIIGEVKTLYRTSTLEPGGIAAFDPQVIEE